MALDKLVDSTQLDTDLTSVADAIRAKGGPSGSLPFPNGFIQAVGQIETNGWTKQTVDTDGAVTQELSPRVIYHFTGALTALTITLGAAAEGTIAEYHFDFNCGSTAPTVTIPSAVTLPDNTSFNANRHYEIDILDNYAAVMSWSNEVTP